MSGIIAANHNNIINGSLSNGALPNSNGLKVDLNIEAPFVKIVHECIVKTFKSHKKYIEKEVNLIVTKINAIKKQGSTKGAQSVIDSIDQLITKLNQLKSRYNKMLEAEDYLFQVMKKRISHLSAINENYMNPEVMKDYFTKRLNRIIIDYMLRENYFESAQIFIDETGLKDFVDLEVFEETSKILAKLKQRDCQDALSWCNTHKTKLQKLNEFIQLIKTNQLQKAIEYSRKQLSKFGEDQKFLNIIQQVMGFLVFRNDQRDKYEYYRDFIDEKRWKELEDLFVKESYQLFALPDTPMISQSLSTGIPIMKTEFCNHADSANQQCPTCSVNIRKLGQKLPFSHQTQTCITCVVTGELMNDQNQPLFLPTGHVISERGLKLIKDQNDVDKVICPFTNESIAQVEVRKVFFS